MTDSTALSPAGDRLAKIIARAGLCSRRDAELWIKDGRVSVNGKVVKTPAFNVSDKDKIKVDGEPLAAKQGTRVWLYHKPAGLVVTEKDPEGRPTIFEALEEHGLPRVVTIGRLDINTEGLLLLTNDGGLKRTLELPATGWLRKYRVRAFGTVTQAQLDQLKDGIEVEGIKYGPIDATLERDHGSNVWLVVALREGKNREVKNVLAALGLQVNRLIRVSYGPFQLGDLPIGTVETVKARVLREQLGKRLADESGADFDSEMPEQATAVDRKRAANPRLRAAAPGKEQPKQRKAIEDSTAQFHFVDRDRPTETDTRQRRDRPGGRFAQRAASSAMPEREEAPLRTVHNEDGTTSQVRMKREPRPRPDREDMSFRDGGAQGPKGLGGEDRGPRKFGAKRIFKGDAEGGDRPPRKFSDKPRGEFGDRPKRDFGDRPKRDFGDRPPRGDRPARSFGDKPKRDFGDRPPRREAGERPARSFGDKPRRDFGDKPKRDFGPPRGDRPARSFGDKPKRDFGDKPKRDFGDRPPRDFAARPQRDFADRSPRGDRPARSFGDKPKRDFSDKPKRDYGDKPRSPRPAGGKPYGDKPRAPRPDGDRPRGPRPGGDRPFAGKPRGPRPDGDRPRGPRPDGDKPRGPRKPRA